MRFSMYPPLFVLLLAGAAGSAQAACYADYKASRGAPLELQYGVAEVFGDCTVAAAEQELTPRLAADDWQLLEVMDTFDETGLEARRESAGEYFLRY
jgi:hypothetical protein